MSSLLAETLDERRDISADKIQTEPPTDVGDDVETEPVDDTEVTRRKKKKKDARVRQKQRKQATQLECFRVEETNPVVFLQPPARLASWWTAYQAAFREEHAWMEARQQGTSYSMGLDAARMLPLVFRAEPASGLERACFVAWSGGGAPCGYATVDVDPNPARVCHLRMLLITPEHQRRGFGAALLARIVARYAARDLGLRYCTCHDCHRL
jgi:GNAT superfamily N-acetyltransferase